MKKYLVSITTLSLSLMMGISSASAQNIPPGLAKKGGLPPGIQKKFIQQEKDNKEYEATIKEIDFKERRITIEDGTALLNLLVSEKAKIQLDKKDIKFEDLRKGDEIDIKLDKDNTVTELKATRKEDIKYTVNGKFLVAIKDQKKVYFHKDGKIVEYQLSPNVAVKINGEKSKLDALENGMEVKLTLDNDKVTLIEGVKEVENKKLEGKVLAKYEGKDPLIIVKIGNDIKVFSVEKDVNLSKVELDKEVIIYVKDNKVTSIRIK